MPRPCLGGFAAAVRFLIPHGEVDVALVTLETRVVAFVILSDSCCRDGADGCD